MRKKEIEEAARGYVEDSLRWSKETQKRLGLREEEVRELMSSTVFHRVVIEKLEEGLGLRYLPHWLVREYKDLYEGFKGGSGRSENLGALALQTLKLMSSFYVDLRKLDLEIGEAMSEEELRGEGVRQISG